MKILTLSNLYPPDIIGGYEVACRQVVDGLIDHGHEVRVLTSSPRQPVERFDHVDRRLRLADEWNPNVMGLHDIVHESTHARSRFIDAHNVYELLESIDTFQPDVVYLNSLIGIGGLGLLAALQQRGVPWVWQLGDCIPKRLCSSRSGMIPQLAEDFNRRFRGTYIAVSNRVKSEIEEAGIVLNDRVERFPNWITGRRPPERAYYRPGNPLRVMSAGAVNRDKGIDVLIEAVALLRKRGVENLKVDIFGKVGDNSLKEMIQSLGLADRVRMMGPKPHHELLRCYREYDLFAFPTHSREPFGLVALEASAQGCVPIMTRDCGVAEWFDHGVHVLKADRSPKSFADTIDAIADGRIPLEPIARRGLDRVWATFHLDGVLPHIEDVLEEAAGDSLARTASASPDEIYRMARLAERLTERLIAEAAG